MIIHAPIHGSQFNPPAKLFKRFTGEDTIPNTANMIKFANNYYKTYKSFRYVEASDKDEKGFYSDKGMLRDDSHLLIKFNGRYIPKRGEVDEPEPGDLMIVRGELWQIETIRRKRLPMLKDMAVVYLELKRLEQ